MVGRNGANTRRSGANAARLGLALKIARRGGVGLGQPQHAAFDRLQQPHPDVEHLGRELVAVVEAAEDEAGLRQACFARVGVAAVTSFGIAPGWQLSGR